MDVQKLSKDDFWDTMYTYPTSYTLVNDRAQYSHSEHLDSLFIFDVEGKNCIAFTFDKATFCLNEPEIFIAKLLEVLKDKKYRKRGALTLLMIAIKKHFGRDLWNVNHWRVVGRIVQDGTNTALI